MSYLELICTSLEKLIANDKVLITKRVKEECINHCLAKYIEQNIHMIPSSTLLSVDLEYDKSYADPKAMQFSDGIRRPIRPDIIVHQRDSNDNNKIFIECKKPYLNHGDKEKLITSKESPYNYSFAIGICYLPEKEYMLLHVVNDENCFDTYKFNKSTKTIE